MIARDFRKPPFSVSTLGYFALLVYGASLLFTGLTAYGSDGEAIWEGWKILLFGWPAVLMLNAAWLANGVFALAAVSLLTDRSSLHRWLTPPACFLALDSLRFADYDSGTSGHTDTVFGYGIGAVLWFCALCIMWVASAQSTVQKAVAAERSATGAKFLRSIAIVVLILAITASAWKASYDRSNANSHERQRLMKVAFKRSAVCSLPDPLPIDPPLRLDGPLLVEGTFDEQHLRWMFWDTPLDLLAWGLESIRVGDVDYSLRMQGRYPIIEARAASGSPAAALGTVIRADSQRRHVRLTLAIPGQPQAGAEYEWETSGFHHITCPESDREGRKVKQLISDSIAGMEVPRYPLHFSMGALDEPVRVLPGEVPYTFLGDFPLASGCPEDIKIAGHSSEGRDEINDRGFGVQLGDVTYLLPTAGVGNRSLLTCSADHIYLVGTRNFQHLGQPNVFGGLRILRLNRPDGHDLSQYYARLPERYSNRRALEAQVKAGKLLLRLQRKYVEQPPDQQDEVVIEIPLPVMTPLE